MADAMDRIVPLDELDDFKVAEGDPDVRGWEVVGSDGRRIGDVDNLLVDTAAMKVRYLDIDLETDLLENDEDRHVLVPIGYARLDEDDNQIFVDALRSTDVATLPAYGHEPLTREYETKVRTRFDEGFSAADVNEDAFYEGDAYDDSRMYGERAEGETRMSLSEEQLAVGKRERQAGEVEVDKRVDTEHVSETVPTRHEEVVVERHAATGTSKPRIGEDEVRVPVNEEELVVEKRAVPKEEVVVKKREVVENEKVDADLRKERVDVHREGDVDVRNER